MKDWQTKGVGGSRGMDVQVGPWKEKCLEHVMGCQQKEGSNSQGLGAMAKISDFILSETKNT